LVLKRAGEVVGIAQLRIIRPTVLKFGIAYLRWGPLVVRKEVGADPAVGRAMARALEEEYIGKRGLFLRILPNAFAGTERAEQFQSAFSTFGTEPPSPENEYRTFLLDLAPPLEELRRNLDKKWRNQLSRAEKNNLTVTTGTSAELFQRFRSIYEEMWKRKAFETSVNIAQFQEIQQSLAETEQFRILICEEKGVPVAGLIASAMGDSAIYLLGATSDEGLTAKGAYLLQWNLVQWMKENGTRWYDLGGIDPERNPGVYHFKKGFAGSDMSHISPFVACKSVVSSAVARGALATQRILRGWLSSSPLSAASNT